MDSIGSDNVDWLAFLCQTTASHSPFSVTNDSSLISHDDPSLCIPGTRARSGSVKWTSCSCLESSSTLAVLLRLANRHLRNTWRYSKGCARYTFSLQFIILLLFLFIFLLSSTFQQPCWSLLFMYLCSPETPGQHLSEFTSSDGVRYFVWLRFSDITPVSIRCNLE